MKVRSAAVAGGGVTMPTPFPRTAGSFDVFRLVRLVGRPCEKARFQRRSEVEALAHAASSVSAVFT
jgi:hypothetical protein